MTQRAGYIVNEDWRVPDCAVVLPQTGLLASYIDLEGFSDEDFALLLDNKTTTSIVRTSPLILIRIEFDTPESFDSFAFSGDVVGVNISVSDSGVDYDLVAEKIEDLGNGNYRRFKSGILHFERVYKKFVEIQFYHPITTTEMEISQISLGNAIKFPRTVDEGFETPAWRSDDEVVSWQSNSPLPSTVVGRLYEVEMSFTMLPTMWMDKIWSPLAKEYKSLPMWFSWDLSNDPDGVVYGPWKQRAISYDKAYQTSLRLSVDGLY